MTTRGTGGNANNRSAPNREGQTRRPRRKEAAEETAATTAPKPTAPSAPQTPTKRSTRAGTTRGTPRAARPAAQTEPAPAEPAPLLPEEVVDEAAPIAERVPVHASESTAPTAEDAHAAEPDDHSDATHGEASDGAGAEPGAPRPRGRRSRERGAGTRGNALGALIEHRFSDPSSPVRSYSELERRSNISREALSRYVTPRADRRRSPTIDTLAAIADAMHLSLEQVCRAAVASARGVALPPESEQRARDEVVAPLVAPLSEDQFSAVVELLRQMQPR